MSEREIRELCIYFIGLFVETLDNITMAWQTIMSVLMGIYDRGTDFQNLVYLFSLNA